MYCQRICGEVSFSLEERNQAIKEIETLTPEQKEFVMQVIPDCTEQCEECKAIVDAQRNKTIELINKSKNFSDRNQ